MIVLLGVQALVVVLGVAALWVWWVRTCHVGVVVVLCGAAAFVASQVVRVPLLGALGLADAPTGVAVGAAILTSGLAEEPARWLVLRALTRARSWADGVGFGLGHGGVEALLVVGIGAVSGVVLLAGGDEIVAQVRAQDPAQADALAVQVAALREASAVEVVLAVVERACAIVVHVALTLLVLQAVRRRRLRWLVVAVVAHCGFNALALGVLALTTPVVTEVVLVVVAGLLVPVILRARAHLSVDSSDGSDARHPLDAPGAPA